jgi:hypothetical protein
LSVTEGSSGVLALYQETTRTDARSPGKVL